MIHKLNKNYYTDWTKQLEIAESKQDRIWSSYFNKESNKIINSFMVGRIIPNLDTYYQLKDLQKLFVIGHPGGITSVISDGAQVRSNQNLHFFQANLDTFEGNSGSPVFSEDTGVLEGILVRGENDWQYDRQAKCYRPRKCSNDQCRGEDVTRITSLSELLN